jgi:MFS family permease
MNQDQTKLLDRLKAFPRPVWVLFFGTFLNKFGTFVIPFLALYMTRQGYSTAQAGVAISAYGVGNFIASGLGGHLADIIGRRNTIVISMFSGAAAMMLLSQAHGFYAIVLATALVGLTSEIYRPASSALLSDLVPAGQRVTAFSAYRLAFNAGWAFGPATAGFLAGNSYFWLFAGDAATSALYGVIAWVALPHGLRTGHQASSSWSSAFKAIAVDRRFLRVLASSLCIALVFLQMSSTFGLQVTSHGFTPANYGALISFNGVLVVLCELPLTLFTQRMPARRMMALGYVLIGSGFAINAFAHTLTAFALVMLVFTFGEMISMPVSSAYVADLSPANMRGRYMGVMGFTWSLALICGPSLGMALFGHNPMWLWLGCGGLGLLAAFIISSGKE